MSFDLDYAEKMRKSGAARPAWYMDLRDAIALIAQHHVTVKNNVVTMNPPAAPLPRYDDAWRIVADWLALMPPLFPQEQPAPPAQQAVRRPTRVSKRRRSGQAQAKASRPNRRGA
jgi:hypothetical protein